VNSGYTKTKYFSKWETEMQTDDSKLQIPLFDSQETTKEKPVLSKTNIRPKKIAPSPDTSFSTKAKITDNKTFKKLNFKSTHNKRSTSAKSSGNVPAGDIRLTANIREDLHLKLKIAAARNRSTIGEIIEALVEQYI
jgi:hypothetical protein